MPISYIGSINSADDASRLIQSGIEKIGIPISKIDERFTSELIKNSKKDRVDDLSALEILETYIKNND